MSLAELSDELFLMVAAHLDGVSYAHLEQTARGMARQEGSEIWRVSFQRALSRQRPARDWLQRQNTSTGYGPPMLDIWIPGNARWKQLVGICPTQPDHLFSTDLDEENWLPPLASLTARGWKAAFGCIYSTRVCDT